MTELALQRLFLKYLEKTHYCFTPIMTTAAKPESLTAGEKDAANYMNLPWDHLMRRFSDELDDDIAEYSALLAMAPPEDQAAIRFLVDHEIVTKAFCDAELAGQGDHSTAPVEALIASAAVPALSS